MTCDECIQELSALIDEELDDLKRQEVMEHLETCASCKETFSTLRLIQEEMMNSETIALPKGFHEEMMARVAKEKQDPLEVVIKPLKWTKKQMGYVACAVAAMFLVTTFDFRTNQVGESSGVASIESANQYRIEDDKVIDLGIEMDMDAPTIQNDMRVGKMQPGTFDHWTVTVESDEMTYEIIEQTLTESTLYFIKQEDHVWFVTVNQAEEKDDLKTRLMEKLALEIVTENTDHKLIQISAKK